MTIFESIEQSVQDKLPFVAYSKPTENLLKGLFQQNDVLHLVEDYSESGFVFAPFDTRDTAILIPKTAAIFLKEEIAVKTSKELRQSQGVLKLFVNTDTSPKKSHIKLVESGIKAIEKDQFKKVVLSRKERIALDDFDVVAVFQKLVENYPNAFVYVWYHPAIGMWLGASPEALLKVSGDTFTTMALAGTQLYRGTNEVVWCQKEVDEQQFVTDYIVDTVSKVCMDVQKSDIETVKAGSLLHLKTSISGKINTQGSVLKTLINTLHPTPAVCGLPKEAAKQFILENENYARSFYTGFLGELNTEGSEFYVNLRCMNIENKHADLYIGGGITKESNPIAEWEETVSKSEIMKKVL